MMLRVGFRMLVCLVIACAVGSLGCGKSTPTAEKSTAPAHDDHAHEGHDHKHEGHDDHPHTYAEAVEKIKQLRNAVRDHLAAKETGKADEAVHEVGHVLEDLPKLAEAHTAEDQAEVKKAGEELLDLFGKIDEQLHADKEPNYDEVSAKIDAAVEKLHEKLPK